VPTSRGATVRGPQRSAGLNRAVAKGTPAALLAIAMPHAARDAKSVPLTALAELADLEDTIARDIDQDADVVLLDRPVIYMEPEVLDEVLDAPVGFDEVTAQYVLGEVEASYDEVIEVEDLDPREDVETEEVVLLDLFRVDPADLEVA
jgi:hypothetical protein